MTLVCSHSYDEGYSQYGLSSMREEALLTDNDLLEYAYLLRQADSELGVPEKTYEIIVKR